MISSIDVGSIFKIVDEASPQLVKIADALKDLQVQIDKTKDSFKLLADSTFGGLIGRIDEVAGSLDKVRGASAEIAGNLDRAMTTVAGSITTVGDSIGTLTAKINALNAELAATSGVARTAERAAAEPAAAGGSGSHGIRAEGVRAGPLSFGGGDIVAAGGLFSLWESLKASADLQEVQENLKISGVSPAEIEKATREAYSIGAQYGLTATSVLTGINETRNILNKGTTADEGVEGALAHADTLARATVVLRDQGKDHSGDTGRQIYDLVKSGEFRNAIGDADFDKAIGSMVKADVATGGVVNPRTFLQMSQYLKSALPGLSDQFLYDYMPELAQEFKGSGAGTAMASLYQQLVAGQMRTSGLRLLDNIGMVDEGKVDFDHNGRIVKARPGYFKDDDVFKSNPLRGIEDIVKAMREHGITDEKEQRDNFSMLFGNRNAAQMALTLAYQDMRLNRGAQGIENTFGLGDSSTELLKNNPYDQWSKFTSSLTNLGAELGTDLMPAATDAAHGLTTVAQALAAVFKAFPFLGMLGQSGFKLGGSAADAAADIGTHTSLGALWQWITGGGSASAAESDKAWSDFKSQFKPGDFPNVPDLGPVPNAGDGGSPWNPLNWFHKASYESGGALGAGSADTIDIVAATVNLANVGGGGGFGGGIMPASYETGGGLSGGAGGLHSGGGYTVLGGGGYGSSILRARGHYSDGGSIAYSGGSAGMDSRGMQLMGYLVGQGWTPEAASIAAGNAQQESSIRSDGAAGDSGISHGMFQWNHLRYDGPAGLLAYASAHGLDPHSLAAQEGFFAAEAEAKIPGWKHQKDLSAAGLISHAYEGYGDNSTGTRIANSKHFLALWKDHAATTPTVAADYPDHGFHSHTVHAAALNAASSGGAGTPVEIHVHSHLDANVSLTQYNDTWSNQTTKSSGLPCTTSSGL